MKQSEKLQIQAKIPANMQRKIIRIFHKKSAEIRLKSKWKIQKIEKNTKTCEFLENPEKFLKTEKRKKYKI